MTYEDALGMEPTQDRTRTGLGPRTIENAHSQRVSSSIPAALKSFTSCENRAVTSCFISGLAVLAMSSMSSFKVTRLATVAASVASALVISFMYLISGPSSLGPMSRVHVAFSETVIPLGVGVVVGFGEVGGDVVDVDAASGAAGTAQEAKANVVMRAAASVVFLVACREIIGGIIAPFSNSYQRVVRRI